MRMFLPIKGPGGRTLTQREKLALLVLGLTIALGALTLLAGENAYLKLPAQNPVFAFVSFLCRSVGGGIVALYGLLLIWSGLVYFKGERIAQVAPLGGRLLAAMGVTVGVSGTLGIAELDTAGRLGLIVGGALGNTFGAGFGFPVLLLLMVLGFHLAWQGAWSAMRTPPPAAAVGVAATGGAFGIGFDETAGGRLGMEPPLPDDGDPTPDERSLAVTQAMEEIERSQGVTIVDVEPDDRTDRPSIGEEVESAPEPEPETEEAEVKRGLEAVVEALDKLAHYAQYAP